MHLIDDLNFKKSLIITSAIKTNILPEFIHFDYSEYDHNDKLLLISFWDHWNDNQLEY